MSIDAAAIRYVLEGYCSNVKSTRQYPAHHPEASLYTHFESAIHDTAALLGYSIQVIPQYSQNEVGAPDFGLHLSSGAVSFVEAKPPNRDLHHLTGQDKVQFDRYMRLPNIIYTNYWELCLYQEGVLKAEAVLVPSQCLEPGQSSSVDLSAHNLAPAIELLRRFLAFDTPLVGSAKDLARRLAPAAWLVRDAVEEAMKTSNEESPLHQIYREFRDVLFYELDYSGFADAYAQTLAYGILLARRATEHELTPQMVAAFVDPQHHGLLAATLTLLSQPKVVQMVGWTINNLVGLANHIAPHVLSASANIGDPLLYFYEDFLEAYDPELRKKRGVYFTPVEVVNLQTRVINHALTNDFKCAYGLADAAVQVLDPAVGTGTYLVSALAQGCERVKQGMGSDNIPDAASAMGKHLHGFEILVGPYTVAHFRLGSAIEESGGKIDYRLPVLLTNTLLPPQEQPDVQTQFGFMSGPLNDERCTADEVKRHVPIMVILGNPPYRRATAESGWVWDTLLESFREPVREHSIDFKNMADLYVWFYRWAVWKLFEADSAPKRGILSFISNSKWILGGWSGGMRQVLRQYFDRIYIIDLHGDNRAPLPAGIVEDENIFDIQVGVAISICIADGSRQGSEARVYYYGDTWGSRQHKCGWLNKVKSDLGNVPCEEVIGTGTDSFFPALGIVYSSWPDLRQDVFSFSISGVQTKRDHLVVAPTSTRLREQVDELLRAPLQRQRDIFHETGDRTCTNAVQRSYDSALDTHYGYRPLDTQHLYNDRDWIDRDRRDSLQKVWGSKNIGFSSSLSEHGNGPAVYLHSSLPDMNSYNGRSSYVLPLWDNRQHKSKTQHSFITQAHHNLNPQLLKGLKEVWGLEPTPENVFAYCYAVLSAPSYSFGFSRDLAQSFPRVPFPRRYQMFQEGAELGNKLVRLHSFAEGYPADGSLEIVGNFSTIEVATYEEENRRVSIAPAAWISPVSPQAWNYSVSGYDVLRQWLLRRRSIPFGLERRKELLNVVWVIERTVELSDELDEFLGRLLVGETLSRSDLGMVDGSPMIGDPRKR